MAKLPAKYRINLQAKENRFGSSWRTSPSVVGRGTIRCGICQEVLLDDEDVEVFEGERCHSRCVESDG